METSDARILLAPGVTDDASDQGLFVQMACIHRTNQNACPRDQILEIHWATIRMATA